MTIGKRLKAIIKEEDLTQKQFASEFELPLPTLESYTLNRVYPSGKLLSAMSQHKRFRKYMMWLLSGETEYNSGQVCPAFSTQEQCGLVDEASRKQA